MDPEHVEQNTQFTEGDDMGIGAAQHLANYMRESNFAERTLATGVSNVQQPRSANQFDYYNGDGQPQSGAHPQQADDAYQASDIAQIQHQAPMVNMAQQAAAHAQPGLGKRKRNVRLDEAQDGAMRVEFDTQSSEANHFGVGGLEAVTQDPGFQQQELRTEDASERRTAGKAMKRRAGGGRKKKSQAPLLDHEGNLIEVDDTQNTTKQKTTRRRTGAAIAERAISPPKDEKPPPTQYLEIQAAARRQGQVVTQAGAREPQKRTPWSIEEIQQLEWLITIYGTSWSVLKRKDAERGNKLANRDQVALKDKSRNMKADYLSQRVPLPDNFQYIPLSKKEIDRVRSRLGLDWEPESANTVPNEENVPEAEAGGA